MEIKPKKEIGKKAEKELSKKEVMPKMGGVAIVDRVDDMKPTMSVSSRVIPDISDMKIGDEIKIEGKFVVKTLREEIMGEGKKKEIVANFEMQECELMDASDDYKEAKRTGMSRSDYEEYKTKKEGKND